MKTSFIVFSKNRPWQLKECLRSIKWWNHCENYNVFVIYKCDPQYDKYYNQLKDEVSNNVTFINESGDTFCNTLRKVLGFCRDYVVFTVDDAFFYQEFNTDILSNYLEDNNHLFYISLRMDNDLSYCHPANSHYNHPNKSGTTEDGQMPLYHTSQCQGDFAYIWDLSASMYRKGDILNQILTIITRYGNVIDGPNDLEAYMNKAQDKHIYFSMLPHRVCSIITINRVQDKYNNPIYDNNISYDELVSNFVENKEFNEEYYSGKKFDSIHIGDYVLKS